MAGDVSITLPSGEAASVPQADLAQAIAAGAVVAPLPGAGGGAYDAEFGGGLGQAASFVFGAGRTASGGVMDAALIEGAGLLGGDQARADMLHGLNVAKTTNQYATMGGEAAGLFLGAGEGVMGAGTVVEETAAHAMGSGLLGRVGSMALRGGTEGAMLGAQHQLSEDTLGDHGYNGERLFAAAAKDGLIGAALGAGLGAAGHFGSEALASFRYKSGPRATGLLDEVAGVEGAGLRLRDEASHAETFIKDIRKAGIPSEDAAIIADEVKMVARARTTGGPLSGILDDAGAMYAAKKAGANQELREVLERGYVDHVKRLGSHEGILDTQARTLAEKGTALMREEEVLNRINFTERPDQFAKLLDPSKLDAAADASARMVQKVDSLVSEFERVRLMGGDAVQMKGMRRVLTDVYEKQSGLIDAASGGAREGALRDMYMSSYKLKQEVGKLSGFGKVEHMRSPSESMFSKVYEDLRIGLEDEAVWGRAGAANREWNETFSQQLPRRQDFGSRYGVSIDQAGGVPKPEVDFDKARGILADLKGGEVDEIRQGVKSANSFVEGIRSRANAIEKYADMTASDVASVTRLRAAADEFETTFTAARKEAAVIGRVRQQAQEEQAKSLGGVIGLATDVMTKPLQTMERLGVIKAATERFEKGIEAGINRFFEGKGSALMRRGSEATEELAAKVRPKDVIAKEIGDLRELAANPAAMQDRMGKFLGTVHEVAPKIAAASAAVGMRVLTYLAAEAPRPRVERSFMATKPIERYSDHDIFTYENKRNAALHPETVIAEMRAGKLNRDGIRAVKLTSPAIFAKMQELARVQIERMAEKGLLDKMPMQDQAVLAVLLETPPSAIWEAPFISMIQASKQAGAAPGGGAPQGPAQVAKRPIKMNTALFETEAQQVEGRTT